MADQACYAYGGKMAGDYPCEDCGWPWSEHPCSSCGHVPADETERPMPRWIDPAKKLPTEYKRGKTISATLVILLCGQEPVVGYYSTRSGWYSGGVAIDKRDVTGWFPLPKVVGE